MGLVSTEVEVKLGGKNIKRYTELGYVFPLIENNYGKTIISKDATITVKVEDLSKGSGVFVELECDVCKKKLKWKYADYTRRNKNGKTYCHLCANKVLNSGINNGNWNPNKTDEEREERRNSPDYTYFVKSVLARDNYTCQCCGKTVHNNAEIHHLDGYNWCKERRTDDTNGVTLCKNCHSNFHSIYGKGNNTKKQYEEWIGYVIENVKKYNGILPTARKIFDYERNEAYDSMYVYAKLYKTHVAAIHKCCEHKTTFKKSILKDGTEIIREVRTNLVKGHHLFWLDEYEKMSKEEIDDFLNKRQNIKYRKVICLTTGEIFNNLTEIISKYKVDKSNIVKCCKEKMKSSGKLSDGTPLRWMYYEDFLKLSQEK